MSTPHAKAPFIVIDYREGGSSDLIVERLAAGLDKLLNIETPDLSPEELFGILGIGPDAVELAKRVDRDPEHRREPDEHFEVMNIVVTDVKKAKDWLVNDYRPTGPGGIRIEFVQATLEQLEEYLNAVLPDETEIDPEMVKLRERLGAIADEYFNSPDDGIDRDHDNWHNEGGR